jgi:WXG100 family type VII secretion target
MPSDIIQADYDALIGCARRFATQAEAVAQTLQTLRRSFLPLQQGGWQGQGSQAFCNEMEQNIFPAVTRLQAALQEAQGVTLKVRDVVKHAEEEAATPFKSTGGSDSWRNGPPSTSSPDAVITVPDYGVQPFPSAAKGGPLGDLLDKALAEPIQSVQLLDTVLRSLQDGRLDADGKVGITLMILDWLNKNPKLTPWIDTGSTIMNVKDLLLRTGNPGFAGAALVPELAKLSDWVNETAGPAFDNFLFGTLFPLLGWPDPRLPFQPVMPAEPVTPYTPFPNLA